MKKALPAMLISVFCSCHTGTEPMERIKEASAGGHCYERIKTLSEKTPARMSGSKNNLEAIMFLKEEMEKAGAIVRTDTVDVPYWLPGETYVAIKGKNGDTELTSVPLGMSVGTDGKKLKLKVIEFKSREEFDKAPSLEGYAVFFNEKMDTTENGYSKAGWQRMSGASMAAKKGAAAVITRSLSAISDDLPRTGTLRYEEGVRKIPAVAISTNDADLLSETLARSSDVEITLSSTSEFKGTAKGLNLTGELKGTVNPENVILVTAHADSWFNSQGAQDNATGCAQAVEVLRIFSEADIKPANTIRVLIYQDEEISMAGMKKYIEKHGKDNHLYNMEIDSGAEAPEGFTLFEEEDAFNSISMFVKANGMTPVLDRIPLEGASFWPLSSQLDVPVYFYMAERSDYFSIHHSQADNMSLIDRGNIEKSCEMIAGFICLTDMMTAQEAYAK